MNQSQRLKHIETTSVPRAGVAVEDNIKSMVIMACMVKTALLHLFRVVWKGQQT